MKEKEKEMHTPLHGIIPPVVTPLNVSGALDVQSLNRLVEHLIAGGVHGLFLLGTTGEGPSLGNRIRRQVIEEACQQVAGRVPMLVAVTDTSLAESIELAQYASDEGADAVVVAPPCYFPMGQADLERFVTRLATESSLPVILYNIPALTKTWFEPDTLRRLAEQPQFIGIKDSSGDLDYFARVRQSVVARPDWSFFIGPEHLLVESLELGGTGGVSGGANLFPRLFVALYEAVKSEAHDDVERLRTMVTQLGMLYQLGETPTIAVVQGVKAALDELGICQEFMAAPYEPLRRHERAKVHEIVSSISGALSPDGQALVC